MTPVRSRPPSARASEWLGRSPLDRSANRGAAVGMKARAGFGAGLEAKAAIALTDAGGAEGYPP